MTHRDFEYLCGGLPAEADLSPTNAPSDPEVGENNGIWIFDDQERFAFFVHLEANSRLWGTRREWIELILADGPVYYSWQYGRLTDKSGPGSGCTKAECIDPFVRWKLSYQGFLNVGSGQEMASRRLPDAAFELAPVTLDAELTMCGPAWQQGTMHQTAKTGYGANAAEFMGGLRYEQLHHATGVLHVNGKAMPFSGRGVRTHRLGRRDLTRMVGHWWHTVTFPSGRAFGCHRFTDPDVTSRANYNEAFVQDVDGIRYPAEILQAPHCLDAAKFAGQRYDIELESALGRSRITCETVALAHITTVADEQGRRRIAFGADTGNQNFHVLNHGITRNTWDGEAAIGLLERSARVELLLA